MPKRELSCNIKVIILTGRRFGAAVNDKEENDMLRKLFGLTILSLVLVLVLCVSAQAAETQEISGQVKASELKDESNITLTGDTVLTLDADRSVELLNANTGGSGSTPTLTLRGEKTLSVRGFMFCDVVMESGVLEAGFLRCGAITINGGEVRADVALETINEGENAGFYSQPLCFGLDSLTVNGGTLSIDGKESGLNNGLGADTITVTDGRIDVKNCTYVAICTGDMTVSGGEVHAIAEGTGISDSNQVSVFENYTGLTVQGGRVEAMGTWTGTTSEDGYSVGVAMPKVKVSGGTLIASGSVSAINSDEPIQLGENVKVRTPEGGYASTEPMLLEPSVSQWDHDGWSGYSILNADGTRAMTAVLSDQEAGTREISGQVKTSELDDGTSLALTGDTVLILDTDRTVDSITGNSTRDQPGTKLTIQGDSTLRAGHVIRCDVTMASGTLDVGYVECPAMTVNGGEVKGDLTLMPETGGYRMPRCINLYNSLSVSGGKVTFDGGTGIQCGLRAKTIMVTDGYIDIEGCNYAAIATASMTVSGGRVHASSGLTGISDWDGIIGFDEDAAEEGRPYEPIGLCVTGGTVEASGTYDVSTGVALNKVNVLGGTLISSGTVSAINCAEPVRLGEGVKVRLPEGGSPSVEALPTDSGQWYWTWSGYSILNADGTRATTAVLSAPVEATATGTMGEDNELSWSYYESSGAVTVKGEGISEATPVIVASYDGDGKMLLASLVTASGDSARADPQASSVRLFWLGNDSAPKCRDAVVKGETESISELNSEE